MATHIISSCDMLASLTGTPGTGKSTVSNLLRKRGYHVVDLNSIAIEKGFTIGYDEKRKCYIIDEERLSKHLEKNLSGKEGITILEGHLSHLMKHLDIVIVLRCKPSELRKRLEEKGWREDKIRENVEAEALDIILCEAVSLHRNRVAEIDTTALSPTETANKVEEILATRNIESYRPGKIDWLEEVFW